MRKDIQQYHDYVMRIEQDLEHWEAGGLSYINELPTLHKTIETLMDLTFNEKDSEKVVLLFINKVMEFLRQLRVKCF